MRSQDFPRVALMLDEMARRGVEVWLAVGSRVDVAVAGECFHIQHDHFWMRKEWYDPGGAAFLRRDAQDKGSAKSLHIQCTHLSVR